MRNLAATNRCHLFEDIADEIWAHVIYNHRAGMDVSEIGITKDIIAAIRNHFNTIPNFGVWANPGYNEDLNGSDIDIFVETTTGNFIWYALQAKALRLNGRYQDMAGIRGGEFQWDKLNRLANQAGCISQYLLYNGVRDYKYSGQDKCNRTFSETQFGCSLVSTIDVERISLLRNPTFRDFHPLFVQPWRVIVCCKHDNNKQTLYNISQVKRAVDYYPISFGNTNILRQDDIGQKQNDLNVNAINNFSERTGRTPYYRMVIRTTRSLFI